MIIKFQSSEFRSGSLAQELLSRIPHPALHLAQKPQSANMLAFMQNYVTSLASHDPTSKSRHMPSTCRMEDMYTSYLNDDSTAAFF